MKATEENVLVVRRSLFDELGAFHGLNFEPQKYLDAFLSRGNNFFLPRPEAEIYGQTNHSLRAHRVSEQSRLLRARKESRRKAPGRERLNRDWRSHE